MSNRGDNWDVYIISNDGTGLSRLTDDAGRDGLPAWSPDGKRIAFVSNRHGSFGLYVTSAATERAPELARLFTSERVDGLPKWSADGRHISFSTIHNGREMICVASVEGGGHTVCTVSARSELSPEPIAKSN